MPRNDTGHTFLELLIVIAIIALIIGVAPNVYSNVIGNYQTYQFANDVVNASQRLRNESMTSGIVNMIEINTETNTFSGVKTMLDIPGNTEIKYSDENSFSSFTKALANDETVPKIYFYPNGLSSGGKLTIENGNISIPIIFEWHTGNVKRGE
jgi:general secretion pathway protein H